MLDQRPENQAGAEAAVAVASAALSRARLDLEFTHVGAPITGRISRKLVSQGNLVAGGDANATLLTTIVSLDTIDAYFDIDEQSFLHYGRTGREGNQAVAFETGGEVGVALPGDKSPSFTGTLNFSENRLDASTGTLRLRARIANPDHVLKPGQFVRVSLAAEPTPSPYAAVYHERHELPANPTLQNALVGLIKKELVGRSEGGEYLIIEPFLARWIEREQEDYGVAARLRA